MDISQVNLKFPVIKKAKYIVIAVILLACAGGYLLTSRGDMDEGVLITKNTQETGQSPSSGLEKKSEEQSENNSTTETKKEEEQSPSVVTPEYIYVDVSGAVNSPMVVCIPFGSRVFEAIEAAGGRNAESSVKYLNLASVCEDGQKIYVPTVSETEAAESSNTLPSGQTVENTPSVNTQKDGDTHSSERQGSASSTTSENKVNLNTAGSEELQTLPGVGPAIASRIIDYRNTNGSFKSAEEIKDVNGIGEKIYEKLKDQICV